MWESVQPMSSDNHSVEGGKYLKKGLQFVNEGDIDSAVEAFFQAAKAFDRAQEFKQITALWEAIGNMMEPGFKEERKEYFKALKDGKVRETYNKWYQFPLVYRVHAVSDDEWEKQKDPSHRQAWAYEWAAKHMAQRAEHEVAYELFLRSAQKAEQSKIGKKYTNWPGKLWQRAAANYISWQGTIEDEKGKNAIAKMESNYLNIENKDKRYSVLANAYRNLRLRLAEAANLTEAEQFKRKESSALTHYYFYRRNYLRAAAEWVSGIGFKYFVVGFFVAILLVLPWIYYWWDLVTLAQNKITFFDAVFYSTKTALNLDRSEFVATGSGALLNVVETALSWLGLGVFLWWLTKRLE